MSSRNLVPRNADSSGAGDPVDLLVRLSRLRRVLAGRAGARLRAEVGLSLVWFEPMQLLAQHSPRRVGELAWSCR